LNNDNAEVEQSEYNNNDNNNNSNNLITPSERDILKNNVNI